MTSAEEEALSLFDHLLLAVAGSFIVFGVLIATGHNPILGMTLILLALIFGDYKRRQS